MKTQVMTWRPDGGPNSVELQDDWLFNTTCVSSFRPSMEDDQVTENWVSEEDVHVSPHFSIP
jgi:hypothetical protein